MHNIPHTEEAKRKISISKKGTLPWNNGKKGLCLNTGRTHFKKGHIPWHKGKHHVYSKETIEKISKPRPNFIPKYKGKTWGKHSLEARMKISKAGRRPCKTETRKKISESQKGNKSHSWKGGRWKDNGYIMIRINGKVIPEHRLIMQKIIGRQLTRYDIVHHKNGKRDDNRKCNLELIITNNRGNKFHHSKITCPFCNKQFGIK
jgi:hypothetical protein